MNLNTRGHIVGDGISAKKLKKKFFIILSMTIVLLFTTLILAVMYIQREHFSLENKNFYDTIDAAKEHIIDHHINTYKALAERVIAHREVKKLIKNKDRESLYALYKEKWKFYQKENPHFKIFHFHLPDGTSFLRMHNPEKFGDKLDHIRPMIKQTHKDKKTLIGYETGKFSAVFRIITPIFDQGKYIGALDLGLNPDFLIEKLQSMFQEKSFLFIKEIDLELYKREIKFRANGFVLQGKVDDEALKMLNSIDKEHIFEDRYEFDHKNKNYILHILPLKDYTGETKVKILFLQNTTFIHNMESRMMGVFTLFALLIFLILSFFVGKQINALQKGLDSLNKEYIEEISYINNVLRVLLDIDQNILNIKDEGFFIEKVCKGLIDNEIFDATWIGLYDKNENYYKIASSGFGKEFLDLKNKLIEGYMPFCIKSIGKKKELIIENTSHSCKGCPLRNSYNQNHAIVLKLEHEGEIYGFIGMSFPKKYIYEEKIGILLFEIADDIAFALYNIKLAKKQNETNNRLMESEERFRKVYENISMGLAQVSLDFKIIHANKAYCQALGYTEEELIGKHLKDITLPESLEENLKKQKMLANGEIDHYRMEKHFLHKNGSKIYSILDANLIRDENKNPIYFLGSTVDITDRKKAEEALRDSEERWQFALEGGRSGVWDWNAETNKVFFSKRWKSIIGYKEGEIGDGLDEWDSRIHPDDKERCYTDLNKHLRGETPFYQNEHRLLCKNGSYKWISDQGKVVSWTKDKKPLRVIGTHTDITDRKKAEEALREKDELIIAQSRHAAMGEMISMIAHQWRQPISVIAMGANNILADIELEQANESELQKQAYNIIKQTQHLSKTIDDFRNFFRPDKEKETVLVGDVMEETLGIIIKSLENNDIKVEKDYNSNTKIKTHSRELLQVFINIIKNAKEALSEKDTEDKKISIKIYEDKESIYITICDNAGGIKNTILNKIFDPYFTTKDKKTGTGLGLYMSKTIIEKHLKGTVEVKNTKEGACFIVILPIRLAK